MFSLMPWKKKSNNVKVSNDRKDDSFPLARFKSEFESLFDRFWSDWGRNVTRWDNQFDFSFGGGVEDKPNEYVFRAELPGFEPGDIDVQISGHSVAVKAEHNDKEQGKNGQSYRYGAFQRYFTLPYGVDESKIEAHYHNGMLELHMPKTEAAQGKRIPVRMA